MYEELSESERLLALQQELQHYLEIFERAYSMVIDKKASKYPILALHMEAIKLGIPIIQKSVNGGNWNINISSMEEFIAKQLIRPERVEEFQALYERKKGNYCLFVLSDLGAQFVFIPRITNI